jgi:PTS system nitrogen regulatory IIA component
MTFYNLNSVNTILPALKAGSQKQALHVLAEYAASKTPLAINEILNELQSQERKGVVSGIGNGVALLSLVSPRIMQTYTILARADQPVQYDSVDSNPVDLLFLIIAPQSDGPLHLQRLARITRQFRDQELCDNLRSADTADAIRAVLFETRHHALAA